MYPETDFPVRHILPPQAFLPAIPRPAPLPEAPCSLNAFVDVDGLRVQVTGRGHTPEEAVTNFRGTLEAVKPSPALEERLARGLTAWIGTAVQRRDWALVERLSKGAALVLAGYVQAGEEAGQYRVRSAMSAETWYAVNTRSPRACECQDFVVHQRKGERHDCKHLCAACLWVVVNPPGGHHE